METRAGVPLDEAKIIAMATGATISPKVIKPRTVPRIEPVTVTNRGLGPSEKSGNRLPIAIPRLASARMTTTPMTRRIAELKIERLNRIEETIAAMISPIEDMRDVKSSFAWTIFPAVMGRAPRFHKVFPS